MTRQRRRQQSSSFAANHQRSWLWGRHAVYETLAAERWPITDLLLDERRLADHAAIQALAARQGLRCEQVTADRLQQLSGAADHQGVIARLGELPCEGHRSLVDAASRLLEMAVTPTNGCQPLFVLSDRIQDAHNFGAILRCCDAMAVDGVIIGTSQQVQPTPHVIRASAGAINHQRLFRVDSLIEAARELHASGYAIVAATEKSEQSLWATDLNCPIVLIVGTEATGIQDDLLNLCSHRIAIPMLGRVNSLNAAVAVGILLAETRRQQGRGP